MAAVWSRVKRSRIPVAGIASRLIAGLVLATPELISMPMRERPGDVSGKGAG